MVVAIKRTVVLASFLLAHLAACMESQCEGREITADSKISVTVEPRMKTVDDEWRVFIDITFKNHGTKAKDLPMALTLSDCEIANTVIKIYDGKKEVDYIGKLYAARTVRLETIDPNQTLSVRDLDITYAFKFPPKQAALSVAFDGITFEGKRMVYLRSKPATLFYRVTRPPTDAERHQHEGTPSRVTTADETIVTCHYPR